ncbi:phage antirepressor KilAC domain-containing protein [Corynebacterium pseudodiphtheriticum]|nr:phage antirepressor KilAC domain-containing protein [Corynebacterium pseudodiphtheriticum]
MLEFTSTQVLLEAAPKVSYYDVVLQSDSLLTITEIAKDYGLSAKKLNLLLHDAGVQFRQSGRWFLYARFAEQGYTQSKTHEYDKGKTRTHMLLDPEGTALRLRLAEEAVRPAAGHRAGQRCGMTTTAVNIDLGFSPHNTEGYPDPTVFKALKNLQRAEIEWAHHLELPITYLDVDFEEVTLRGQ